jgi:hypothetical protein
VPFVGHNNKKFYWGLCPKHPHFGAGIGISSLSVESNNFKISKPILVIHSSNNANPQKEFGPKGQRLKFAFWELLIKNSPKGVSQPKYSIA